MNSDDQSSVNEQIHVLYLDENIVKALIDASQLLSEYLNSYIHLLNRFISHLRRVNTMRFERTTLIKFVKKLRFFNECVLQFDPAGLLPNETNDDEHDIIPNLEQGIKPFASFYIKSLECIDLLNYYFTKSLQKEIISKTLNEALTLPTVAVERIDDSYNHFVKFAQWMVESLRIDDPLFDLEVIQFCLKCAEEDQKDPENSDNIFLQEVIPVLDEKEYCTLMEDWVGILRNKLFTMNSEFDNTANEWHRKFGKIK